MKFTDEFKKWKKEIYDPEIGTTDNKNAIKKGMGGFVIDI